MPRNIEIKAQVIDPQTMRQKVIALAGKPKLTLTQTDTFFQVAHGRLKLRILQTQRHLNDPPQQSQSQPQSRPQSERQFQPQIQGELIFYLRPDKPEAALSTYWRTEVSDPSSMVTILQNALGLRGVVHKRREVYMIGQTRVHLDDVADLGHFIELEVVLTEDQTPRDGQDIAQDLIDRLDIKDADLLRQAYIDLLENKSL